MTKNQPTIVQFAFEKETPGTMRFQEVDAAGAALKVSDGAVIGTLYVRKTALNGLTPKRLEVSITAQ